MDGEAAAVAGLSSGGMMNGMPPGPRVLYRAADDNTSCKTARRPCAIAASVLGNDAHGLDSPQQMLTSSSRGHIISMATHDVNRKRTNPAVVKNRKWAFFQTVNHSKIV